MQIKDLVSFWDFCKSVSDNQLKTLNMTYIIIVAQIKKSFIY